MARLGILSMIAACVAALAVASVPGTASAGKPCARTKFETALAADACKKGGQEEAQKAMKKFLSEAKKKKANLTCNSCHTKLAPGYPLKKDGLKMFVELGGKRS